MPGQSARVVEMEVTSKVEAMLSRINGVQGVNSLSSAGRGWVKVRLSKHIDPDMARFEISTVIRQTWPSLPEGISYPSIYMSGTTSNESVQSPYLRYIVNAPFSPMQIQEYINDNLKPKLAEIPDIDRIDISGASRMIYKLEYDYTLLQNMHVSVYDIQAAIRSYLGKEFLGIGRITDENTVEQWIRIALISEDRAQPFDPSVIQVKNINGKILYLDNLVKTSYEEEEVSSFFRINGLNSIYLSLTAKEDANQLALSTLTKEMLEKYKENFPEGYELHLSYDAGEYLQDELDKIYFRSGLTVLILLCFVFFVYRNFKYSLLVISSLIANITIAAIFYYLLELEMQLYSLAGLTISLNLIIDNTIIMSDQIIRRGNKKAFMAILAATLTSVGALSVILFMDEKIRVNMQDFAWVIMINLTISLFIALFLVPALVEKLHLKTIYQQSKKQSLFERFRNRWAFLKRITRKIRGKRIFVYLNRIYEKIIVATQKRKCWIVVALIFLFGLPIFMLPDKIGEKRGYYISDEKATPLVKLYNKTMGSTFYKEKIKPISDVALGGTFRLFAQKVRNGSYASGERSETSLYVTAWLPNGSTKEQMDALVRRMETYIRQYPEVKQFETHIENGQKASIRILFMKEHQRGGFPYRLRNELIRKSNELGGGSWGVYGVGDGFNNDVKDHAGTSRIKLLGYNYDELQMLSEKIRDSLLQNRRIKEVTIDSKFSWYKTDYTEFVFDLDKEKLSQRKILPVQLYRSFSPLFGKNISTGEWIYNDKIEYIRMYSKQSKEFDIWNMENYQSSTEEQGYKLVDIVKIEQWQAPQEIAKENQQYLLCIQYEYIGAYQQEAKVMQRRIDSFNDDAPLGYKATRESYQYWWGDSASRQYKLLFLIILIIFFMASILFNSLTQPLIVLFIIPISYIGLFLTFYLFKLNFDQGGFAAFILLTGISVNANIYVLNEYNNIQKTHPLLKPLKAYIKAWNSKILPIFLTIFSSVLGFIPFMIGQYKEAFWFPLAAGTVGGLIMSFITLFLFLPLFMGVGKKRA
jgi:multidrug efflux pump subunit AcrB